MTKYYLLSLRHTLKENFCFSWHLKAGYTYDLNQARVLTEKELSPEDKTGWFGDLAIPVDTVNKVAEKYMFNGNGWEEILLVKNTAYNRGSLNLKLNYFLNSGFNDQKHWFRSIEFKNKLDNISTVLKDKKKQLISLLPQVYKTMFVKCAYIAGGSIYSLYNDKPVNDYDFFLTNPHIAKRLKVYMKSAIKNRKVYKGIIQGTYKGCQITITKNAISFCSEFQIITGWSGSPIEVISEFDFMHNMCYFYRDEVNQVNNGFNYLDNDSLAYNEKRARDICGTIQRIPKFVEKGFKVPKKEVSKMLGKLAEKGFDDREMEIIDLNSSY